MVERRETRPGRGRIRSQGRVRGAVAAGLAAPALLVADAALASNSVLTINGSKNVAASTLVGTDFGRIVRGATVSVNLTLANAGVAPNDNTSFTTAAAAGLTVSPTSGSLNGGTTLPMSFGFDPGLTGITVGTGGVNISGTVTVHNLNLSDSTDIAVHLAAHVVEDRVVTSGTAASPTTNQFGGILVGSTRTLPVTFTTANTNSDKSTSALTRVTMGTTATTQYVINGAAPAASNPLMNVSFANLASSVDFTAAGSQVTRNASITPLKSGDVSTSSTNFVRFSETTEAIPGVTADPNAQFYFHYTGYQPASIVIGGDGSSNVTIADKSADVEQGVLTPRRADAVITAVALDAPAPTGSPGGFTTTPTPAQLVGTVLNAGAAPQNISYGFFGVNLVPGRYTAFLNITLQHNDQTIAGTAANDLGTLALPLVATVNNPFFSGNGTFGPYSGGLIEFNAGTQIGKGASGSGTFTQAGADVTIDSNFDTQTGLVLGTAGGAPGTWNQSGGSLSVDFITLNKGTFNQTGGTLTNFTSLTNNGGVVTFGGDTVWGHTNQVATGLFANAGTTNFNSAVGSESDYSCKIHVTPSTGSATVNINSHTGDQVHLGDMLVNPVGSGGAGLIVIGRAANGSSPNPQTHFGAVGGSVAVYIGNGQDEGDPGYASRATVENLWKSIALEGWWAQRNGKVSAITRGVTLDPSVVSNPNLNGLTVIPSVDNLGQAVTYVGEDIQGDANGDGQVDVNDLGVVLQHLGTTPGSVAGETGYTLYTPGEGDVNADLVVDVNDLGVVLANLNKIYAPASSDGGVAAIPEPATAAMLLLGAAAMLRRRRK